MYDQTNDLQAANGVTCDADGDLQFDDGALDDLGSAVGFDRAAASAVVGYADKSTAAKNRRKAILKLLALLQNTA